MLPLETLFLKDTNFIKKICTDHLEVDGDNAINLVLHSDTIFPDQVYLKRWNDPLPDKADARLIKVKEELESAKCYSIVFSKKPCSDTDDERCTAEKRNALLGPQPTTEPVTSCLCTCAIDTD